MLAVLKLEAWILDWFEMNTKLKHQLYNKLKAELNSELIDKLKVEIRFLFHGQATSMKDKRLTDLL